MDDNHQPCRQLFLKLGMDPSLRTIFSDRSILVVDKPAGQLFHGRTDGKPTSLVEQIRNDLRLEKPDTDHPYIGVVHRLDRPVSGVCVFGRNSKFTGRLSQQFSERSVQKLYLALVHGKLEKAGIVDWQDDLEELPTDRRVGGVVKNCRLALEVVANATHHSLVQINLQTGRRHQIRRQFAKRGFPIVGDTEYGAPALGRCEQAGIDRRFRPICLHSFHITLSHPITNERVSFVAHPPEFWQEELNNAGVGDESMVPRLDWSS